MYLEISPADFAVFRIFGGISRDFAEKPEFRGSATARNIRSPDNSKCHWWGDKNCLLIIKHYTPQVTKGGKIIDEKTYRLNMAKKEHRKHVRDLLATAIVHKTLDVEVRICIYVYVALSLVFLFFFTL